RDAARGVRHRAQHRGGELLAGGVGDRVGEVARVHHVHGVQQVGGAPRHHLVADAQVDVAQEGGGVGAPQAGGERGGLAGGVVDDLALDHEHGVGEEAGADLAVEPEVDAGGGHGDGA